MLKTIKTSILCTLLILCYFSMNLSFAETKKTPVDNSLTETKKTDVDNKDYKIGIGDVLKINTWKEEDLSFDSVQVRNDGKITFPLLDDLQAAGLTTMALKKIIEEKLADFVEAPTVTITLAVAISQQYYILGEVQVVGAYPLVKKLTVVQAFALAKGFTEWASKDEIILFRREDNTEKIIKIDYDDIVKGNLAKDILLKADDIIVVP